MEIPLSFAGNPKVLDKVFPMLHRKLTVLLLIESSRGYGRGCLRGVADYCRIYGNWQVIHVERTMNEPLPQGIRQWKLDGIISRSEMSEISQEVDALELPTVDLRGSYIPRHGVSLDTDPVECARLAVEHFYGRGLRDVAYCGYGSVDFSDARGHAFREIAQTKGCRAYHFESPVRQFPGISRELSAEGDDTELIQWLRTLPTPCGVFACNDVRGRQVLRACAEIGIAVPEQLAVVGVDNDSDICDLTIPTMSSIEPDTHRVGFMGATYLAELMNGNRVDEKTYVKPKGVVARASSEMMAIADHEIAGILNYIGRHACDGLNVEMLCEHFRMSRSSLERRLKKAIGRNAKAEIDRVRIERAKLLLRETDRKLLAIAHHVAYSSASKFAVAFKRITGQTPGEFRNQDKAN